jgi:hypothetical protein
MAVQLPSFSTITARVINTRRTTESLWVGVPLAEIQYSRNKLGINVDIIAKLCHSRNSALGPSQLHGPAPRRNHENRS